MGTAELSVRSSRHKDVVDDSPALWWRGAHEEVGERVDECLAGSGEARCSRRWSCRRRKRRSSLRFCCEPATSHASTSRCPALLACARWPADGKSRKPAQRASSSSGRRTISDDIAASSFLLGDSHRRGNSVLLGVMLMDVDRRQPDERSGPKVGRKWAGSSTLRPTSGPAPLPAHFGPRRPTSVTYPVGPRVRG